MWIVALSLCIILFLLGRAEYKTYINPISIYNLSWSVCILCNYLLHRIYGSDEVNLIVYAYVIITCIVFSFTCAMISSRKKVRTISNGSYDTIDYLRYRRIVFFNVIAILSSIPVLRQSISLLQTKGIYAARYYQMIGSGTLFILQDLWKNMVIQPVFLATIFITIDGVIYGTSKQKRKLIILSIIDLVIFTFSYFGRWMILEALFFALIVYFARIKQKPIVFSERIQSSLRRTKRLVVFLIIVLSAAIIIITSKRTMGDRGSIIYTGVLYFGGSLKYLDLGIKDINQDGFVLFGAGLFASIWDNFIIIFQKIAGVDFFRPQEIVYFYNGPIKSLGNNVKFTGFGTVLINMYLDGRIFGVVIDSSILGLLAMFFYSKLANWGNARNRLMAFYSLLIAALVTIQWDGNRLSSMMVFIYFLLMIYRPSQINSNTREISL